MTAKLLLAAAGLLLAAPALADTAQLGARKDNTLYQNDGGLSNGAGANFFVGLSGALNPMRRGLIAFDVSTIPAGSLINSVTLRLQLSRTNAFQLNPVALHRVLADWGEGTSVADGGIGPGSGGGDGAPATANDATWINRFFPGSAWITPGGDFAPVASVTLNVGGINSYTFGSTPDMVADVQRWVDSPGESFGWILLGDEGAIFANARRFDSRENPVPAARPLLTVEYTPSPVSVGDGPGRGALVELLPVAPNPSPEGVVLRFRLTQPGRVRVAVHDARGRLVASLVDAELTAGEHAAPWNALDAGGSAVPSGVYWARVNAAGVSDTRSFVIAR